MLHKDATLGEVQINALGIPAEQSHGGKAQKVLQDLGIDTSRSSVHKGMLLAPADIDDEIAKATGAFKITLEEIKKRKLHKKVLI